MVTNLICADQSIQKTRTVCYADSIAKRIHRLDSQLAFRHKMGVWYIWSILVICHRLRH